MHDEKKGLGELIKALDTDGDGEVSQKELFGHKNYKPDPGTPDDEKAIQMKMLDAFFNAADENADKKLDVNELFMFHNLQDLAGQEPKEYFKAKALDHITYMDKNNDGDVDWAEFQAFMLPHVKAAIKAQDSATSEAGDAPDSTAAIATHMKKFKELFDEADLNKDGKLDNAEMQKNLAEREEWIKTEAATETMAVADDNKDGKVSLNEVIKNAGEYGAKTEDFFEDSELLHVGDGEGDQSAMAKQSETEDTKNLRGGGRR